EGIEPLQPLERHVIYHQVILFFRYKRIPHSDRWIRFSTLRSTSTTFMSTGTWFSHPKWQSCFLRIVCSR
ncbi:hypothetical protein Csa_016983, partial [Cucumis sativus]